MFYKIKILLLDDKPATSLLSGNDYIPKISFEGTQAEGLEKYFELEYLQSLSDIKEYRFFYQRTRLNNSSREKKLDVFVPDAVLFDYNFKISDELENDEAIEELLNVKLASTLKYNTYRKKHNEELSDAGVTKWAKEVNNNAFGCFAGAVLVYDFGDNACIGLPTTAYEDGGFNGKDEIAYFEDLLKSDFGDAFSIKGRTNPSWFELIKDITKLKRERILSMAQEFRVSFDLENILQLVSGAHIDELKKTDNEQDPLKAGFTFTTPYGKQCFHLTAIFLDIQDENERDNEIKNFATKIFQLYGVDMKSYDRIVASYNKIWNTFCKSYEKIFEFSLLQLQSYYLEIPQNEASNEKINREKLQSQREKRMEELKKALGIEGEGVNADFSNPVSVFEETELTKPEKMKVMLLLIARLYWNYLSASKEQPLSLGDITNEEIAVVLSPIRSEYSDATCILPLHRAMIPDSQRKGKNLKNQFAITHNNIGSFCGKSNTQTVFDLDWVLPKEKKFVCGYFSNEVQKFEAFIDGRLKNIVS